MVKVRIRKNKSNNEDDYKRIKDYYTRALQAIESDEPAKGGKIILTEMPVKLYDLSLDILENKNDEFSDQELRRLISNVDMKLIAYSKAAFEEDSDSDLDPDDFDVTDDFPEETF